MMRKRYQRVEEMYDNLWIRYIFCFSSKHCQLIHRTPGLCNHILVAFDILTTFCNVKNTFFWYSYYGTMRACSVTQSCLTLCNSGNCSPPGSFVHGVFQARILEWGAISYSRRSSQLGDWTPISCFCCIGRQLLYQETWVQSLGREDPPEKEMSTHSSILSWRIPWTEEPGGLLSMGMQRVRHDLSNKQQWHQVDSYCFVFYLFNKIFDCTVKHLSSLIRDQTCVSWVELWSIKPWTTKKAPDFLFA